ncbi:MAG: hypothetical protein PHV34_17645 [Verrucomicrobiae bacterium]|nr:hypothetical protein [Verrucomicrobiae bacterium]
MTYSQLIAAKLEGDPALLQVALAKVDRWLKSGHSAAHRLEQWHDLVSRAMREPEGLRELLALLRGEDPARSRLLDFNPFAGLLTREERRQATDLCGYRH